jgi:hypothetical protein
MLSENIIDTPYTMAMATEDIYGNYDILSPGLPIIKAGEMVLVFGKKYLAAEPMLIIAKLNKNTAYPIALPEQSFNYRSQAHFTKYEKWKPMKDFNSRSIYFASNISGDSIFEQYTKNSALYDYDDNPERAERVIKYATKCVRQCLEYINCEQYIYLPQDRYTLFRFTDPVMSKKIKPYESYDPFCDSSSNFLVDCKKYVNIESLVKALNSYFFLEAGTIFKDLPKHNSIVHKHEGKALVWPTVYFYFTNTEHFMENEKDRVGAIGLILDSMLQCADKWPGDIDFYQDQCSPKIIHFVFYYHEVNSTVKWINHKLQAEGLRTLGLVP